MFAAIQPCGCWAGVREGGHVLRRAVVESDHCRFVQVETSTRIQKRSRQGTMSSRRGQGAKADGQVISPDYQHIIAETSLGANAWHEAVNTECRLDRRLTGATNAVYGQQTADNPPFPPRAANCDRVSAGRWCPLQRCSTYRPPLHTPYGIIPSVYQRHDWQLGGRDVVTTKPVGQRVDKTSSGVHASREQETPQATRGLKNKTGEQGDGGMAVR